MRIEIYGSGRITEHFKLSEFVHNGSEIYIDDRPAAYNAAVGGSSNSSHLFTGAVDFPLPSKYYSFTRARKEQFLQNVKTKWSALCQTAGVYPQVNFYDTYLHLGISTQRASYLDKRTKK